ncbi:MAG: hypothetical protein Q4G33_06500 [bacterium]|nr:hypothetical protein [bacterium]
MKDKSMPDKVSGDRRILKRLVIILAAETIFLAVVSTFALYGMVCKQREIDYLQQCLSEAQAKASTLYPAEAENHINMILQWTDFMNFFKEEK